MRPTALGRSPAVGVRRFLLPELPASAVSPVQCYSWTQNWGIALIMQHCLSCLDT